MKKKIPIIVLSVLLAVFVIYGVLVTGTLRYTLEENAQLHDLRSRNGHITIDEEFVEMCAWEVIGRCYVYGGDMEWAIKYVETEYELTDGDSIEVLNKVQELLNSKVGE